ncbi:hypothetical protein CBL_13764 [Carabus blaptoides fortunei]
MEAEITESRLTIKGEQLICTKPALYSTIVVTCSTKDQIIGLIQPLLTDKVSFAHFQKHVASTSTVPVTPESATAVLVNKCLLDAEFAETPHDEVNNKDISSNEPQHHGISPTDIDNDILVPRSRTGIKKHPIQRKSCRHFLASVKISLAYVL